MYNTGIRNTTEIANNMLSAVSVQLVLQVLELSTQFSQQYAATCLVVHVRKADTERQSAGSMSKRVPTIRRYLRKRIFRHAPTIETVKVVVFFRVT